MKTFGNIWKKIGAIALMTALPAVSAMPAPRSGGFEAGIAAGFSGAAASIDLGIANAGCFDLFVGLDAGNPWTDLAPFAEFNAGASVPLWRSAIRLESSAIVGVAKIPGIDLVAPYGGAAVGFDFPLGRSGFAIRTEALAKFGGREYEVSATNQAGMIRYVDSWAPALFDIQIGFRWKPGK